VEEAVKVLAAYESELDRVKAEAVESKKRLLKVAADEGDRARKEALAKAQAMADERVAKVRKEAETEAAVILDKGKSSLKLLNSRIAKKSDEALELVTKHLLGD
jgi:vacuolar-type H+-ATPase subunit H